MNRHQRKNAISNAHVGKEFELYIYEFFKKQDLILQKSFPVSIGINNKRKSHKFDLGSNFPRIIIECKSHKWTAGNNVPSAKLTAWNEAMYYFLSAPNDYRKIFFVLRDISKKRNESLAEYYIRVNSHLIPDGVEIWEYDTSSKSGMMIYGMN